MEEDVQILTWKQATAIAFSSLLIWVVLFEIENVRSWAVWLGATIVTFLLLILAFRNVE